MSSHTLDMFDEALWTFGNKVSTEFKTVTTEMIESGFKSCERANVPESSPLLMSHDQNYAEGHDCSVFTLIEASCVCFSSCHVLDHKHKSS